MADTNLQGIGLLDDAFVELRSHAGISAATIASIVIHLQLQALHKGSDTSSLKLYLGPAEAGGYRLQDRAACGDITALLDRPLDIIVRSAVSDDAVKALLTASGKRYALPGARFYLGVLSHAIPYDKNKDNQVRRNLFNAYTTDLQTIIMRRTGMKDRALVHSHLLSARGFNALEALGYGEHGLIDAIVVDSSHVVTRASLDSYIKKSKARESSRENFLHDMTSLEKLPKITTAEFNKRSLAKKVSLFYNELKVSSAKETEKSKTKGAKANPFTVFISGKKLEKLPQIWRPQKDKCPEQVTVLNAQTKQQSLLNQDTIFFCDSFHDKSAQALGDALLELDHKKRKNRSKDHILIIENSPGGSIISCQELCGIIQTLRTPVDIVVHGMGASAGSWMLCHATGNRLATPQARIMIHEAATKVSQQTPHNNFNELHDQLDQSTIEYINVVSRATGRTYQQVLKDFDYDVWLNPVESLLYGKKGFIDGVLLGNGRVLTRKHLETYLEKLLGGKRAMKKYIDGHFALKQDPRGSMKWKPETHDEKDPLSNPLVTLEKAGRKYAELLCEAKRFSQALKSQEYAIDYYAVVPK
jgi:ATP-dependent protease ClpP protease subunit